MLKSSQVSSRLAPSRPVWSCRNFFVYSPRDQSITVMKIRRYPITLIRRRADIHPEPVSASMESKSKTPKKSSVKPSNPENNG